GPFLSYRRWCVLAGQTEDIFVFRKIYDQTAYKTTGILNLIDSVRFEADNANRTYQAMGYYPNVYDWFELDDNDSLSYTWSYDGDPEVIYDTEVGAIYDAGTYTFYFEYAPTETTTRLANTVYYRINKLKITYTAYDFMIKDESGKKLIPIPGVLYTRSANIARELTIGEVTYTIDVERNRAGIKIGSQPTLYYDYQLDQQSLLTYDGSEWGNSALVPFFYPQGAEFSYQISSYKKANGTVAPAPSRIEDAGEYTITVRCSFDNSNYEVPDVSMVISVQPKRVTVEPYITTADGNIVYGSLLADHLSYRVVGEEMPITELVDISGIQINSNYNSGSNIGNYYVKLSLVPGIHNNYIPEGSNAPVYFEVKKASARDVAGYNAITFSGKVVEYNGRRHTLEAAGVTGDFYIEYRCNGQIGNTFIDAGYYEIEAYIYIKKPNGEKNENYNYEDPLKATLIIDKKPITLKVKDYPTPINYNDELPPDILFEIETPLNEYSIGVRDDGTYDEFVFEFVCSYR
ncbi:MAG TPA: hypothetical protein PLS05_07675, partial [Clostridia bacterium]|nr:hypothetical protein [Clostridia bacterium]